MIEVIEQESSGALLQRTIPASADRNLLEPFPDRRGIGQREVKPERYFIANAVE